jgi:aspartate aminotransferase-like enzyme
MRGRWHRHGSSRVLPRQCKELRVGMQVDLAVTGSQKALSLPCGLGLVCASEKALAAQKGAKLKRVYYDFKCAAPPAALALAVC